MQAVKPLFDYPKYWAECFGPAPFLPMSREEMDRLGWDSCDIIIVTGDAYVAATLETILIDPSVMPEGEDDKARLFGLLSRIISSLPVSLSRGAGGSGACCHC